ncbi:hypothetical protein B0H10DRAFT_661175 [Mycena sp. CBHHK59/15]|nr:hypothetical protein B0H10DRAFT_661175 [Mycena sp. CBHHK59/15]
MSLPSVHDNQAPATHDIMDPRDPHGFPPFNPERLPHERLNVGIVGGGIAGLYAALLLQREGHLVRIFEGTDRTGGRVHTHYFSQEANQYYEAGAMRIPQSQFHQITFDLIDYVNSCMPVGSDRILRLINYVLTGPGNGVYVNGTKHADFSANSITPKLINWPNIPLKYEHERAEDLMMGAIGPLIKALEQDFDKGFEALLQFDNFSFRFYLQNVVAYPTSVIDFMETVLSQTNQFALSVTELVMQNMDFDTKQWWTIDRGMSRLPNVMAYLVGYQNITFGARVTGVRRKPGGGVTVRAVGYNGVLKATFDRVILAIPPAALKMIVDRPTWPTDKEMAIRSMHFEPLYKMGLRFRTRFWEHIKPNVPSEGGQTTTDLPVRWIVFPSNGIGSDGPGVLLVYAW